MAAFSAVGVDNPLVVVWHSDLEIDGLCSVTLVVFSNYLASSSSWPHFEAKSIAFPTFLWTLYFFTITSLTPGRFDSYYFNQGCYTICKVILRGFGLWVGLFLCFWFWHQCIYVCIHGSLCRIVGFSSQKVGREKRRFSVSLYFAFLIQILFL